MKMNRLRSAKDSQPATSDYRRAFGGRVSLAVFLLAGLLVLLAGCTLTPEEVTVSEEGMAGGPAADYCAAGDGVAQTRYPFFGTNNSDPLRLFGSLGVCTFTAEDGSRITIGLDTLYTDEPTLAALAYRAQTPIEQSGPPGANPSSRYCTQVGGTDTFGGISVAGGGWALEDGSDVLSPCVFPDLSVIGSWGLTYHANNTIRGADLDPLLRYSE